MVDIKELERQQRANKAKNLRYKKAIALNMNLDGIKQWVWDTFDSLDDVTYVAQNDEMFVEAFDGDEEEAFEFRMAFNSLAYDLDRFRGDLNEEWIPDCFDDFFCSCAGKGEQLLGYDAVEQDYFGLRSYEASEGQKESQKRLERLTKKDLIEAAQKCFQVAVAFLGLRSRFEDLRAAVDIIRAQNDGLMHGIKAIEELYDQYSKADYVGKFAIGDKIDAIADQMPDEVWVR